MHNKVFQAYQHSRRMFMLTDDREYYGQMIALEAVYTSLCKDDSRLDHLKTFVKKEHRDGK